jgi:hypothetical protein
VRAMLDLVRENRAQLQDVHFPCQNLMHAATRCLKILDPVRGDKKLVKLVDAELAKLSEG